MPSKKLPFAIKYYHPTTCYDGIRDFVYKPFDGRCYPDEYLIVNILESYLDKFYPHEKEKIVFIKESWIGGAEKGVGNSERDGSRNEKIGEKIIEFLDQQLSRSFESDMFVLAPFLFKYHHPGIAIDLKNKVAIYVDPFGSPPYEDIADLQELKENLIARDFKFEVVSAKQQKWGEDGTSCGPILTDSMIAFIKKFLGKDHNITGVAFEEPQRKLATKRLVQMNIRNPNLLDIESKETTVDEISLAEVDLWMSFFEEQGYTDPKTIRSIIQIVEQQKACIKKMIDGSDQKEINLKSLAFIVRFQLKITHAIQMRAEENINSLIQFNAQYFGVPAQTFSEPSLVGRQIDSPQGTGLPLSPPSYFSFMNEKGEIERVPCDPSFASECPQIEPPLAAPSYFSFFNERRELEHVRCGPSVLQAAQAKQGPR